MKATSIVSILASLALLALSAEAALATHLNKITPSPAAPITAKPGQWVCLKLQLMKDVNPRNNITWGACPGEWVTMHVDWFGVGRKSYQARAAANGVAAVWVQVPPNTKPGYSHFFARFPGRNPIFKPSNPVEDKIRVAR